MAPQRPMTEQATSANQMQRLRELVLGEQRQEVTQVVKSQAREWVGDVVTEALHDRQKQDGSVNQVLVPLVEASVEKSVSQHSEKMVSLLYPLVGRLARKSVAAFLNEFLEKTNELIENSLTVKGLKWRYRAWRSGVSFSRYVASQTFLYQVEQVLLIHRKTGILLKQVATSRTQHADADMVSGMLTAIDDFVSDSFTGSDEETQQHLNIVKTDDFSLVIKQGPDALLVAAVTGNMPADMGAQLQSTLETIHSLYSKDLHAFDGDTLPFETAEQLLRECLLAELKPEVAAKKRVPWMAWCVVALLVVLAGALLVSWWQQQTLNTLATLDEEPGISVTHLNAEGLSQIHLGVLRDPQSIALDEWLARHQIDAQGLHIDEKLMLSLDPALVAKRLQRAVAQFPSVTLNWIEGIPSLSGTLTNARRQALAQALASVPGITNRAELIAGVSLQELDSEGDTSPEIVQALLDLNVAKIDRIQLEFAQGMSDLSPEAQQQLTALAAHFKDVTDLAEQLALNVGLIIMGASDGVGNPVFNQRLSLIRAKSAQKYLVEQGVEPGFLNTVGLGVVEHQSSGTGARKVLFNVVVFDTAAQPEAAPAAERNSQSQAPL